MFCASNVSSVCIRSSTRDVTELTTELIGRHSTGRRLVALQCRLFLLVLLSIKVLLVGLRSGTADLAHFTVVNLCRLRRNFGLVELLSERRLLKRRLLLPRVRRGFRLLRDVRCCCTVQGGVVTSY